MDRHLASDTLMCKQRKAFTFMLCVSDSMSMVRLQDQVREARRLLDKERSTRASMENKRKNLEKEKMEVIM